MSRMTHIFDRLQERLDRADEAGTPIRQLWIPPGEWDELFRALAEKYGIPIAHPEGGVSFAGISVRRCAENFLAPHGRAGG